MRGKSVIRYRPVFVYAPGSRFHQGIAGLGDRITSRLRVTADSPLGDPPSRGEAFCQAFIELEPGATSPGAAWISSIAVLHPRARIWIVITGGGSRKVPPSRDPRVSGVLTMARALAAIARAASRRRPSNGGRRGARPTALENDARMVLADTVLVRQGEATFVIQDGIVTHVAMPLLEELGWRQEDLLGHHFSEFVAPEKRSENVRIHEARMSGKRAPRTYESVVLSRRGDSVPIEIYVRSVEMNGRPAAIGTMRNISERYALHEVRLERERQIDLLAGVTRGLLSEGTLLTSLEAILPLIMRSAGADRACISLSDRQKRTFAPVVAFQRSRARLEQWSPVACMPGCRGPSAEVIRRLAVGHPLEVAPCIEGQALAAHHLLIPFVHKGTLDGFVWLLRLEGSRWTAGEVALLSSISGEVALGIEYWRLFDNLKASYANLVETQKELLHKQRLAVIGNMAGHLAHEIRNPLATIMNATGQVRRRLDVTGLEEELFDIVEEELARLRRICDDLVLFSRPPRPRPAR